MPLRACSLVAPTLAVAITANASPPPQDPPQHEFAQVGCGPPGEKPRLIKHKNAPMPDASPGKAIVYAARKGAFGRTSTYRLGVNGRWVAVLDENNYAFFEVEPGPLRICYVAMRNWFADATELGRPGENNVLLINAEEGKKYYLRGENGALVYQMAAADWQKLAARFTYVTFEAR